MFQWLLSEAVCTRQVVRGWVKCKTWSAVFTAVKVRCSCCFLIFYIIVKNCSWVVVVFNCAEGILVCCFCSTAPQRPAMPMPVSSSTGSGPASQQQANVAVKQETDGSLTESKPSVEMQRRPSITSPTAGNDVTTPSQPMVSGGVGKGPAPLTLMSPTTQLPPQPTVKTPTSATPSIKVVPNPNLKKGVLTHAHVCMCP